VKKPVHLCVGPPVPKENKRIESIKIYFLSRAVQNCHTQLNESFDVTYAALPANISALIISVIVCFIG
jgi:hypothetical protein